MCFFCAALWYFCWTKKLSLSDLVKHNCCIYKGAAVRLVWAERDHETATNIRRLVFFLCCCGFSKHLFKKVKTLDMRHVSAWPQSYSGDTVTVTASLSWEQTLTASTHSVFNFWSFIHSTNTTHNRQSYRWIWSFWIIVIFSFFICQRDLLHVTYQTTWCVS